MRIVVSVIDALHGRPAEGVGVTIRADIHRVQTALAQGSTNADGKFQFSCSADGETHQIELDTEAYFTSLGIAPFHKKVQIFCRLLALEDESKIVSVITPYSQFVYAA